MIDFLFCGAGILLGIGSGLIPGMHINNFLPFFLTVPFTGSLGFFFIIGASMGFIFSSFFPSILLGVPNEETAIMVLPGHRMVLEGNAFTALLLSFYGALIATFLAGVFLILFLIFLPVLYPHLDFLVVFVLVVVMVLMVITDNKFALLIILMASVLGFLTFNFNLLLPLLTGFFGLSTMLISLLHKTSLPKQKMEFKPEINKFQFLRVSLLSSFLSSLAGLLPGVSSSIVALVGRVFGKLKTQEFIVMISGTNAAYMIYSFFALFLISKTRSGSAVFLSQIMQNENILFTFGVVLISGIAAALICLRLTPHIVSFYRKIDYRKTTIIAAVFIVLINFLLCGLFGLLILFTATSIGLLCCFLNVKRINCMAALIVPTIFVLV